MRRISIFGSTGSIGCSTLDLVGRQRDAFHVVALTGGRNIVKLAEQAKEFRPEVVVCADEKDVAALREALAGTGIEASGGRSAILEAAARPTDWTMSAILGAAGLEPGLVALQHGGVLALANKESLVCAGPLMMEMAARHAATILPVDSEHSAVFQALNGERVEDVERLLITASGGAFRDWPIERLATATAAQAATHPTWDMGQRITIDSASMFNKALELIEAHEYFGIEPERIEVLVHPESLVHAIVGFADGGLIAHVGPHDMRHAIGYALNWPARGDVPVERLDFAAIGSLTFRAPDETRWPALRLAREVMQTGGLAGAVFNGAKERALDHFIAGRVGFLDMAALVERVLVKMSSDDLGKAALELDIVRAVDAQARALVDEFVGVPVGSGGV
ncbi:1-deoxy-D-xylulose-5-phosphate reductoisomerase [Palleronia sp.]|uniref:1-deoxy-D-xylulose-5-phosphate reductoisomerase n=1 Tax=Palleronia sp. TaxID=1940284 RepID=UPI0035C83A77